MDVALGFGLIALGIVIYLIPGIVAHTRAHHQENAIVLLNLFLGWTFIGWVAALVWAATAVRVEATAKQATHSVSKPMFPNLIAGLIGLSVVIVGGGYLGYNAKKQDQSKDDSVSEQRSPVEQVAPTLPIAVTTPSPRPAWCADAASHVERMICDDDELSKLDMELAETFEKAKQFAEDTQAFSEESKARWKQRETECQDKPCIFSWYTLRKGELQAEINEQPVSTTPTIASTTVDQNPSNSDVMTKKLSNCLLPKAQYGHFSSFDGGKSAQHLLENDCQDEYLSFVSACSQEGHTKDQCLMSAVIAAQFAIKSFNK